MATLGDRRRVCEKQVMHSDELYPKYRGLALARADERRSADLSLSALHAVLRDFQDAVRSNRACHCQFRL